MTQPERAELATVAQEVKNMAKSFDELKGDVKQAITENQDSKLIQQDHGSRLNSLEDDRKAFKESTKANAQIVTVARAGAIGTVAAAIITQIVLHFLFQIK